MIITLSIENGMTVEQMLKNFLFKKFCLSVTPSATPYSRNLGLVCENIGLVGENIGLFCRETLFKNLWKYRASFVYRNILLKNSSCQQHYL